MCKELGDLILLALRVEGEDERGRIEAPSRS